jgi:prolyl oligopeptidase
MTLKRLVACAAVTLIACTTAPHPMNTAEAADPHLWLEDVQGDKALTWVTARNATTQARLEKHPRYEPTYKQLLAILDARDRIAYVSRRGDWLYNFWKDAKQPRGLWRRTTLAEYRKPEPAWETVLDLDALGAAEKENWVWSGATCLAPDYRRCLLALSRGGADATVVREFDTQTKRFVETQDRGFVLPEAKTDVAWLNADTLLVGSDFGPGSLTDSGYPRVIKRWQRGQPLAQATTVFEGQAKDVSAWASVDLTPGFERTIVGRATDFYNSEMFLLVEGKTQRVDKPSDASVSFWYEHVLVQLRSDWKTGAATHKAGSLLAMPAAAYLRGERNFTTLFAPTASRSLDAFTTTRSHVLLTVLDNVAGRIEAWKAPSATHSAWQRRDVAAPFPGTLSVSSWADSNLVSDAQAETFTVNYTDFLTPDSFLLGNTAHPALETLKRRPAQFDATGMKVDQFFATSKDGTRVPYFVVWPKGGTHGALADGRNPTLLYGYGGFEGSQLPWYSAGMGNAWAQHGGVLVVANIRGGGEFGPAWHQAAIKAHKQKKLRRLCRRGRGPDCAQDHQPEAPGHHGGQQRRPAGGRSDAAAARALRRRGVPSAAPGHAALPQALGRRELDGRIRRPRKSRGMGFHLKVQPLPKRPQRHEAAARAAHHQHPRRSRAPRPRAQDGRPHDRARPQRELLGKHRRRSRRRRKQPTTRHDAGAGVQFFVGATGALMRAIVVNGAQLRAQARRRYLTRAPAASASTRGARRA